ncbi:hypothetical protein FF38_11471 [Lucilia cuprina]|uniref:Uncharacterized protein n=1 Tax=Lucilia cuprina TaxID=7375 RepID=A0A0L0CR57_LUCCU|nr:hypothetical protein FF38_11471 [Lucilia cuprina]
MYDIVLQRQRILLEAHCEVIRSFLDSLIEGRLQLYNKNARNNILQTSPHTSMNHLGNIIMLCFLTGLNLQFQTPPGFPYKDELNSLYKYKTGYEMQQFKESPTWMLTEFFNNPTSLNERKTNSRQQVPFYEVAPYSNKISSLFCHDHANQIHPEYDMPHNLQFSSTTKQRHSHNGSHDHHQSHNHSAITA